LPQYQGLGFGQQLLRNVRSVFARQGFDGMTVWALEDNERAMEFYVRSGGRQCLVGQEAFGTEIRQRVAFDFPVP
jgi:ribosomal protein S18 acetylase RimI-like enzyme